MFSRWHLSNFKSFEGQSSLHLAPLTLFCGANSSGKSSIIQSILLIKQTILHAPASRPIALNGPLVRLGAFSDIENSNSKRSRSSTDHSIGIGWKFVPIEGVSASSDSSSTFSTEEISSVSVGFHFDIARDKSSPAPSDLHPRLQDVSIRAAYSDEEGADHVLLVSARQSSGRGRRVEYDSVTLEDGADPFALILGNVDSETASAAIEGVPGAKVVGCITQHFFPHDLVIRYDRNLEAARNASELLAGRPGVRSLYRRRAAQAQLLSEPVQEILRASLVGITRASEIEQQLFQITETGMPSVGDFVQRLRTLSPSMRRVVQTAIALQMHVIEKMLYSQSGRDRTLSRARVGALSDAWETLRDFFRFSVRYLGPLRDDPKPLYPLQALAGPTDVGPKGELTAAVLYLNERIPIEYLPSTAFTSDDLSIAPLTVPLHDAVIDWLRYLGIAIEFQMSERGKFGHELRIKTDMGSEFQDLTNVGVGVSQILPIVVTCLLAEKGSTIILEQPELHLHPAVQARLADFFISMSLLRKQCIIETHGEYLVERIRFRVVSDPTNTVLNSTRIWFLEQKTGATSCRNVPLTRYGAIEDWPEDFFDQSQKEAERIVIKAMERRKSERNQSRQDQK